jgi:hypothetical protein
MSFRAALRYFSQHESPHDGSWSEIMSRRNNKGTGLTTLLPPTDPPRPVLTFKFRAECSRDAFLFLANIDGSARPTFLWDAEPFPDVEVIFSTFKQTLAELVTVARSLPDLHVIAETIQQERDYTGRRTLKISGTKHASARSEEKVKGKKSNE